MFKSGHFIIFFLATNSFIKIEFTLHVGGGGCHSQSEDMFHLAVLKPLTQFNSHFVLRHLHVVT